MRPWPPIGEALLWAHETEFVGLIESSRLWSRPVEGCVEFTGFSILHVTFCMSVHMC